MSSILQMGSRSLERLPQPLPPGQLTEPNSSLASQRAQAKM